MGRADHGRERKRGRPPTCPGTSAPPGGSPALLDARRHPLVLVLIAVCFGIALDHQLGNSHWITVWCLLSVTCWMAWWIWPARRGSYLGLTLLLASLAGVGGAWHHRCWRWFPSDHLGLHARPERHPVCLEGRILSGPRFQPPRPDPWGPPREAASHLLVQVRQVREGSHWRPASGVGRLRVRGAIEGIQAGDSFRLYGFLRAPGRPANPGDFDFARRLRMERELFLLDAVHPACIVRLQRAPWWSPRRHLERLRRGGRETLARYLTEHEFQLASALLLGARELLSDEQVEPFFLTGTVHILAISGLHLGILVSGIWILVRLGRISDRAAIVASLLLVLPYAVITECRPPVVRAAVFVLVVCGGRWLARPVVGWNTLAAAGLFLLAWNPLHLFQTGVHLSFLALVGLGAAGKLVPPPSADPLDRLIESTRPWLERTAIRGVRTVVRLLAASLAVWLLTLPLIASQFHLVSLAGILLNPLLWLPLAGALFSGFGLLLAGWLLPAGWLPVPGPLLGWCCAGSLQVVESLIETAASVRFSHVWTAAPPGWWATGFYLLVAWWLAGTPHGTRRRVQFGVTLAWLALGIALMFGPRWPGTGDRLVCTFFSVGHGTCVLIETPEGELFLYDAGHLGPPRSVVRTLSHYLWSARSNRLQRVIISHADMDHFNAIPALAERFRIDEFWVPPHVIRHRSPLVLQLRDHLQRRGMDVRVLHRGAHLGSAAGWQLDVLHPPPGMRSGSDNAQSLVIRIHYAGRSILLPGDLETPGLEQLLQAPPLPCDVVMAPHHGIARSDPLGFMAWSRPRWVIVSGGNPVPPSSAAALQHTGAELRETSREGAIRVEIHLNGAVHVRGWRREAW